METTPRVKADQDSRIPSPHELAADFRMQVLETARRRLALRRHFSGAVVRWRRAARKGPNAAWALLCVIRPGQAPTAEVWPYSRIEGLATQVSDAEVWAELQGHGEVCGDT